MPLNLEECAPEDVAAYTNLDELLEAVNASPDWTDRKAEVVEYFYVDRLLRLIRTNAPREAFEEFDEHLVQVVHPLSQEALDGLGKPYFQRWSMLRDLLESRLQSLQGEVPPRVLQREHVRPILDYVASKREPVSQKELQQELNLRKANLSRILSTMEANELIDKLVQGNGNLIALGPRGREHARAPEPAVHRPPPAERPGPSTRPSIYLTDDSPPPLID